MALVNCGDCGHRMSDSAPSCPQCGWVVPVQNGLLVVSRKGQLNSGLVGTEVGVDGAFYGTLRAGQQLQIELAPGPHYLDVSKNNGGSGRFRVDVASGAETHVQVSITVMGGMKISGG